MLFFIVKYANVWGFFCRRRRGYLSSLLGSLSSNDSNSNGNLKINNWEMVAIFVIIASSSHPLLLTEHAVNGLVEAPLNKI